MTNTHIKIESFSNLVFMVFNILIVSVIFASFKSPSLPTKDSKWSRICVTTIPGTPRSALVLNVLQLSRSLVQPAPSDRSSLELEERVPSEPGPASRPSLVMTSENPVCLRASLRLENDCQEKLVWTQSILRCQGFQLHLCLLLGGGSPTLDLLLASVHKADCVILSTFTSGKFCKMWRQKHMLGSVLK